MTNYRKFKRAEMHIPGLAIKHILAREDKLMEEMFSRETSDKSLEHRNNIMSQYQEVSGKKGLARMARAGHKYKTGKHQLRLLEKKL